MEAMGFMKRLKEAQTNSEKIKVIFQYPASDHAVIKSGEVLEVYEDGFLLEEIYDGKVVYSYNFIVEVKGVENDLGNKK